MDKILPEVTYRYYLTYKNKRSEIYAAPEGWDTDTIGSFKRDETYAGIMRTLSLPVAFVLDGYNIVKTAFEQGSFEAEVIFECEKLDPSTFGYLPLFKSDLDFSTYEDDGIRANVELLESGVSALIRAKEDTKFEYPLTGIDVVNIVVPGVVFNEKADFIFLNEGQSDRFMPAIDLVNNDTNSGFVTVQNVEQQENITDESIFDTSDNWFVRNNRPNLIPINIKGFIKGVGVKTIGSGNDFAILIKDESNTTIRTIYQSPTFPDTTNIPFDVPFDFVYNLNPSQRLFFYIRTDVIPSNLKVQVQEGDLTVSYSQVSDPSNCKGIKSIDLFKRIIRRIAPQQQCDSFLLKNQWQNLIITCGNGIREIESASIQTTLKDFFNMCNAIESAGMGFDTGVLRVEQRPFFYRPAKIDKLTGVKSCKLSVWTEGIFNAVEVGYKDGNTDDTDGQFEYNSGQEWDLPLVRVQRKESWLSPYRADQYGIEKLRVNFIKKTDDTSSDNDVFMFDCYLDGINYKPILGSSYISVSGMPSNDAGQSSYNLRLTPKQSLLRHESYLRSICDMLDGRYIEMASAEKNKNLETVSNGQGITANKRVKESEAILISTLNGRYFRPIIATLQAKPPINFMSRMDGLSFGYLEWDWQGIIYKGYVLDVNIDLSKNSEREVKLLLTDAPQVEAEKPPIIPPVLINNVFCSNQQTSDTDVNTQVKESGNIIFTGFIDENEYKTVSVGNSVSVEVFCLDGGAENANIALLVNKNGVQDYFDATPAIIGASIIHNFTIEQGALYEVYGFPIF